MKGPYIALVLMTVFLVAAISWWIISVGDVWGGFVVMSIGTFGAVLLTARLARLEMPVKTITVTRADGSTETVTTRVRKRSHLICPECAKQFLASPIGYSHYGGYPTSYHRDPEAYATKNLRWHLIREHNYDRAEARKVARTAAFTHEDRPI